MPRRVLESQTTVCTVCGHRVVYATTTPDGRPIAIDVGARAYMLILNPDNTTYKAAASSAYPAHLCRGKED